MKSSRLPAARLSWSAEAISDRQVVLSAQAPSTGPSRDDLASDARRWLHARGIGDVYKVEWVVTAPDARRPIQFVVVKVLRGVGPCPMFDKLGSMTSRDAQVIGLKWYGVKPDASDVNELTSELAEKGWVAVAVQVTDKKPGWTVEVRAVREDLYNEVLDAMGELRKAQYYIARPTLGFYRVGDRPCCLDRREAPSSVHETMDDKAVEAAIPVASRRWDGLTHLNGNGEPRDPTGLGADVAEIVVNWVVVDNRGVVS